MISVNFSFHLSETDPLVLARNAIFEAMFERAADQLEQDVYFDTDDCYRDLHVDDLSIHVASQLFELLDQVSLLGLVTADVSTHEEMKALSKYADKVAIELV
jgi:hypothetical protein